MIEITSRVLEPMVRRVASMYLEERANDGSVVLASPKNLELYMQLFKLVCARKDLGLCFHDHEGNGEGGVRQVRALSLWGPEFGLETSFGRTCIGQFTYVLPEFRGKGLGKEMYAFGLPELQRRGFTHFAGAVEVGNDAGNGNAESLMVAHPKSRVLQHVYVGEI